LESSVGAKTYVGAAIRLAAAAVVTVLLAVGTSCSSPDVSFRGLSNEQFKDLLPSESEIDLAVGRKVTLGEPEPIDFRRSATAAPNPGLFPDCYAAYFGTPESNSSPVSRGYTLAGWTEGSPLYPYTWHLVERPSAEEARRVVRETIMRLGKCRHFAAFDPGVAHGLGVTFRKITGAKDSRTGAGVAVAVGDVTISFSVSGLPPPEAREIAQEMATVMEKHLKAVSPD
jgi:hypothetical protein